MPTMFSMLPPTTQDMVRALHRRLARPARQQRHLRRLARSRARRATPTSSSVSEKAPTLNAHSGS